MFYHKILIYKELLRLMTAFLPGAENPDAKYL